MTRRPCVMMILNLYFPSLSTLHGFVTVSRIGTPAAMASRNLSFSAW